MRPGASVFRRAGARRAGVQARADESSAATTGDMDGYPPPVQMPAWTAGGLGAERPDVAGAASWRRADWVGQLLSLRTVLALYLLMAAGVTAHLLWGQKISANNFQIFRWSFYNMVHGNSLYVHHPEQYFDLYKYGPTFALLMAPMWVLPKWAGLLLWNLVNVLAPYFAVRALRLPERGRAFILLFTALELAGTLQNCQSNGLVLGLMIGALAALERGAIGTAALLVCLGFNVKVFGAATGVLFLMYPGKQRFLMLCAGWEIGRANV